MSKKKSLFVFAGALDNFWTFLDIICHDSVFLGCPTICPLQHMGMFAFREGGGLGRANVATQERLGVGGGYR